MMQHHLKALLLLVLVSRPAVANNSLPRKGGGGYGGGMQNRPYIHRHHRFQGEFKIDKQAFLTSHYD